MSLPTSNYPNKHNKDLKATLETSDICFTPKSPETTINPALFDSIAYRTAQTLAMSEREQNKPTQIRRFYDELMMWDNKVNLHKEKFPEYLPFIRMLNAKVAYAEGRKHVDSNFTRFMQHSLSQVTDAKTLHTFKLFFEAMLGFYKLEK